MRQMFQRADRVVVLGRRDRETAVDLLGVDTGRLTVLGNCVPDPGPRAAPSGGRRRPSYFSDNSARARACRN